MVYLSKLAIFWLAFACFVVPLFVMALIFSIIKAVRTHYEIKQRIKEREAESCNLTPSGPQDAEIITTPYVRKKPNFFLIEDEDRRKQFRTNSGQLMLPEKPNIKKTKYSKAKDTNVSNVSDELGSDFIATNNKPAKLRSQIAVGRNGHIKNISRIEEDDVDNDSYAANDGFDNNVDDEIIAERDRMLNGKKNGNLASCYPTDTPIIHNNVPAKGVKNVTHIKDGDKRKHSSDNDNVRNCKSLDEIKKINVDDARGKNDEVSKVEHISLNFSESENKDNGSISNGHVLGRNNLSSTQKNEWTSATDVTSGDGVVKTEMELGSITDYGRSKSEDNLIEQRENITDRYLTPEIAMMGSENHAYAKSTETTAM